jgi:phage terminase large subunit-like protein
LRAFLSGLPQSELETLLGGLSPNAVMSLPWLFEHWAHGHQLPPEGDWSTWLVLGGRGAGKTRAGAEWVRAQVEGGKPEDPGACSRVALVGATLDEAREVMVLGPSGILACSPPDRRPEWQASRRRLVWPNGATAQTFSANNPESFRGPQFDAAWCDELAKWTKTEAWDMLQFGLRLGAMPRAVVTTTPQWTPLLKTVMEAAGTVTTRAGTRVNRMHLAESFLQRVTARYAGTHLERQELEGEIVTDHAGALWTWKMLETARALPMRDLDRVVVAVDPPVTGGRNSDECGIVVAGVAASGSPMEWTAEILSDESVHGASPQGWAKRAVEAFHAFRADRLVAEVNQGGDLIAHLIRQVDPMVPITTVRASVGKGARAEPVAALYEQGRIRHRSPFPELDSQLTRMTLHGFAGSGSPDRVDALVWAITDLMIAPAEAWRAPRIREL